jgi:hypothetical protein
MAAAVHKLLHPHSHGRSSSNSKSEPEQHSTSPHERQDSAMDRAREDEKRSLAQWEEHKRPLSPDKVASDPERKMVGHSSQVLRQEDFELVKTLGTGAGPPSTAEPQAEC